MFNNGQPHTSVGSAPNGASESRAEPPIKVRNSYVELIPSEHEVTSPERLAKSGSPEIAPVSSSPDDLDQTANPKSGILN